MCKCAHAVDPYSIYKQTASLKPEKAHRCYFKVIQQNTITLGFENETNRMEMSTSALGT